MAAPVENPTSEVRIGLVLYGGVSLAIYIYGVAYEFWRLMRANAGVEENAYTPLLKELEVRAVVDIISGASAGGINGVLLGKALAAGGNLRAARQLWVEEGDLGRLLRDPAERAPRSLLRSDAYDELLLGGFGLMDRTGDGQQLVDVLDVFAPGTRVRSWNRDLGDDLGDVLQTREYRKIFHLKLRQQGFLEFDDLGYDRNDFAPARNGVLASVARSTGAFPFAFEPRLIEKEDEDDPRFGPGEPAAAYFSDGGILHNRPFTEAIETIYARAADRPVSRWLLSVEPDPEHVPAELVPGPPPEVTEVVGKALVGIPRYQSIAADLDRLRRHGQQVARIKALLEQVNRTVTRFQDQLALPLDEFASFLAGQVLHDGYQAMRRAEMRDDLVAKLLACGGLDETYRTPVEGAVDDGRNLLGMMDTDFHERRVYFLLTRLGREVRQVEPERREPLTKAQRELWAQFERIRDLVWRTFGAGSPATTALSALADRSPAAVEAAVVGLLPGVANEVHASLTSIEDAARKAAAKADAALAALGRAPALSFTTVFDRYELWDMFILPIDRISGGGERDEIKFARISPVSATYIAKSKEDKVAGDSLGHFGGFLKETWRENDILWGRLDAAEIIVRVLVKSAEAGAETEPHVRRIQEEIARDELPTLGEREYRAYLEREHRIGSESLADVPMEDRATLVVQASEVFRNMLRRLEQAEGRGLKARGAKGIFRALGRALGFGVFVLRWPVRAVWGRDLAARRLSTLILFFALVWAVVTVVLAGLGLIHVEPGIWYATGVAALAFLAYVALLAIGRRARYAFRRRSHHPPGGSSEVIAGPPTQVVSDERRTEI